jgi:very-short-patch-repair endonuclease
MYDRTSLEQIVADELRSRNLEFLEQHPTRSGFVLDFVLSPNIVLEADGPCHDGSKNKRRDRFRDRILKSEGWHVFRLGYELIADHERFSKRLDMILGPLK